MNRIFKGLGVDFASGNHIQSVNIDQIPNTETKLGPVKIMFNLIGKFYEMPVYDLANTAINEIIVEFDKKEDIVIYNDTVFRLKIDWEYNDNFEEPIDNWMIDVIDQEEYENYYSEKFGTKYVEGFRLYLYPSISEISLDRLLKDGFDLMEDFMNKSSRREDIKIRRYIIAAGIISNENIIKEIHNKLSDNVGEKDTKEHIYKSKIGSDKYLLVIYIKDRLSVFHILAAINKEKGRIVVME